MTSQCNGNGVAVHPKQLEHEKKRDVDYIFQEIVGGNGLWQWLVTAAVLPVLYTGGFTMLLPMYAAEIPKHRCYVEQCDNEWSKLEEPFVNFSIPKVSKSAELFTEADPYDKCHIFSSSPGDKCAPETFSAGEQVSCDKYVYDRSQFEETMATKLDLVCDEEYKVRLLTTIMMIGLMTGSFVGGRLSDKIGRKKTMFLAILLCAPSVLLGGFINNYYAYAALRLLTCFSLPLVWVATHAHTLEIYSPKHRSMITALKDIPLSAYILVLIVYFNRHWTDMHLVAGLVTLLPLPLWFFIPESPRKSIFDFKRLSPAVKSRLPDLFRWLASNNKRDEAEAIFLQVAKINGKTISPQQYQEMKAILNTVDAEHEDNLKPADMFRYEHLPKTLVLFLCWNTVVVSFYALTFNATKLHGDGVMNFLFATMFDSPVFILVYFILDGWGRRWTLFASLMTLGLCTLVLAFTPKSMTTVIFLAYMTGKTAGGLSFVTVYVFTAELYPTNLRGTAVGICSMISRVGGMGANFVPVLGQYWQPLPMVILGVPSVIAAILALFLSETTGKDLPQTMQEAAELEEEAHNTQIHFGHNHDRRRTSSCMSHSIIESKI